MYMKQHVPTKIAKKLVEHSRTRELCYILSPTFKAQLVIPSLEHVTSAVFFSSMKFVYC